MPDMPDKPQDQKRRVSGPATLDKETARLEGYAPLVSGDTDAFIQKVTGEHPRFAALLAATNKEARAEILAAMDWRSRQFAYMSLGVFTFHLGKRSRPAEALALERINYEVATTDPDDRLDSFLGHTQPRNVGDIMNSIGGFHEGMGEYSQALASYLEAEARYQQDEVLRKEANTTKPGEFDRIARQENFRSVNFAAIAGIYERLGDETTAQEYTKKAWQYSKRGSDPNSRVDALMAAANGAKKKGDLDTALGACWEALTLALSLSSSYLTGKDVVEPLNSAGRIYAGLGLNRRALELLERAREINERSGHLGRLTLDHIYIAEVHAARGDPESAITAYQEALRCSSQTVTDQSRGQTDLIWRDGDNSRQLVRLESAWRILLAMARLERARDQDIAMEHLLLAVRVIEHLRTRIVQDERRVGYQAPSMDVYDELIDLLAEQYEKIQDPVYLEKLFSTIERAKGRVLYEMLADQKIAKPLRTSDELIAQETDLLQEIEKLQKSLEGSARSSFEIVAQLGAANEKLAEVWKEIAISDPDEGPEYVSLRKADVVSCDEIRETLRSSGNQRIAVANYYLARKRLISVCLYSDKSDLHYHSEPIDREEVRSWALVNPADPPSADLRLPYWVLDFPSITVSPIADAIAGYDVVCVALHDVLHSLPLHAFPVGPTSTPVVVHSTMTYVPSASILRFCLRRRQPNVGSSLIVGNPNRADQVPIPRSETEAMTIAALLNSEAITGAAATCTTVMERGSKADYLHLACHCKFRAEDPLNSALMLSDGDLTARDIFGWRLNSELVVLSACESGVSKVQAGDELIGLVRAFLFAGTPTIIVSLWNAYDGSAAEVMQDFYRGHIDEKKSMALALADAQRIQIRKGAAPAQWAPFVVVGDWR